MNTKHVDPEKYGMVVCPSCNSGGYIQSPIRQCCPTCGGFGFIRKEGDTPKQEEKPIWMTALRDSGGVK